MAVMAMPIIKSSFLIHALMGHTLVNQIIVELNSLILPGNSLRTPPRCWNSSLSNTVTLISLSLQSPNPPLSLY